MEGSSSGLVSTPASSLHQSSNSAHEAQSSHALLVRNLRLLDLHLLPDWPQVKSNTFRVTNNARIRDQNRVRTAEWILYHLFELWAPADARNKLAPFFPALEPLQSVKLRAALFQLLSGLKHTGFLGRECVLRKSMLDECKGERFEDLLFVFSSLVLRKAIREKETYRQGVPPALHCATDNNLSETELCALTPLTMTYEHTLRDRLSRWETDRGQIRRLEGRLAREQEEMQVKIEASKSSFEAYQAELSKSGVESKIMKKQMRHNSAGNDQWLNTIISGENNTGRKGFVEDSFENLWAKGAQDELAYPDKLSGLIFDLETRLAGHQARLSSWRTFQQVVSKRNEQFIIAQSPKATPRKSPQKSRASPSKSSLAPSTINSKLSSPDKRLQSMSQRPIKHTSEESPISRYNKATPIHRASRSLAHVTKDDSTPEQFQHRNLSLSPAKKLNFHRLDAKSGGAQPKKSLNQDSGQDREVDKPEQHQSSVNHAHATEDGSYLEEAQDILAPRSNGSDFSTKRLEKVKYANLAERTRKTLGSRTTGDEASTCLSPSDSSVVDRPSSTQTAHGVTPLTPHLSGTFAQGDPISLAERTRKSMAVSNATEHAATLHDKQAALRRSPTKIKKKPNLELAFPINPFEAHIPPKDRKASPSRSAKVQKDTFNDFPGDGAQDEGSSALSEQLLETNPDPENVFKTRSKIRMSPPGGSPVRNLDDDIS